VAGAVPGAVEAEAEEWAGGVEGEGEADSPAAVAAADSRADGGKGVRKDAEARVGLEAEGGKAARASTTRPAER
jgi:hypothetical protein